MGGAQTSTENLEPLLYIPNSDPGTNDSFGWSVAKVGGDIVVGARGDDLGAVDTGTVYLFDQITGEQLRRIPNPDPNSADRFGHAVATSRGNILIGTIFDKVDSVTHAGSASVFAGSRGRKH